MGISRWFFHLLMFGVVSALLCCVCYVVSSNNLDPKTVSTSALFEPVISLGLIAYLKIQSFPCNVILIIQLNNLLAFLTVIGGVLILYSTWMTN